MSVHQTNGWRPGTLVSFRGTNGAIYSGPLLGRRNDHILVGVQSTTKPRVYVRVWRNKDGSMRESPLEITVPNNAIWAVPFGDVVMTSVAA